MVASTCMRAPELSPVRHRLDRTAAVALGMRQHGGEAGIADPRQRVGHRVHRDQPGKLDQDVVGAAEGDAPHTVRLEREGTVQHDFGPAMQTRKVGSARAQGCERLVVTCRRRVNGLVGPEVRREAQVRDPPLGHLPQHPHRLLHRA